MNMKQSIILILASIFCSIASNGQSINLKQDSCWLDVGYGIYFSGGNSEPSSGTGIMLGFNVQQNSIAYKLRFISSKEFDYIGPNPKEHFSSLGLMIGKVIKGQKWQTHISGGLGFTSGHKRGDIVNPTVEVGGDYQEKSFFAPSIPLEIEYIRKCTTKTGYSLSYFADLNSQRPYFGFAIKVLIGRLRQKTFKIETTEQVAE